MKIKILKMTPCGGKVCKPGDVVDASNKDAKFLCAVGKAEVYVAPKKAPAKKAPVNKSVSTDELETR